MNKFGVWLKRIGESILAGIRRFPATVFCAAAIMAIGLIIFHNEEKLTQSAQDWLGRIACVLALGIPLSVALRLFFERKERRPVWIKAASWVVFAAFLTLYLFYLLPEPLFNGMEGTVRYVGVMLFLVLAVVFTPYLFQRPDDERFAIKLMLRLFATGIFTGVLIGGVSLVLLMLDQLLGVNVDYKAYADNAIVCFGLFAPSFFLAGIPGRGAELGEEPFQPLIRILFGYIIFPLLAAYTAIIYAFFIRILLLRDWPSNMMVNMVLWYTTIGVLSLYAMRSQCAGNKWFRFFDRWYPRLTVLPIALMFVGLFIRIAAYGFTEPRYLVLSLSVWVSCITAIAILRKPEARLNLIAPALLAALALIAVFGPLSAFSVSRISQNARLNALLARNSMLTSEGRIQKGGEVSDGDKREIYAVLDYFVSNHSLERAHAVRTELEWDEFAGVLGFERPAAQAEPDKLDYHFIYPDMSRSDMIDIAGYDYFFTNNYGKYPAQTDEGLADGGLTIGMSDGSVFTVTRDGQELYNRSLEGFVEQLDRSFSEGKVYTLEEMTFEDENGSVRIRFIIQSAVADFSGRGGPKYAVEGLYALIDIK